MMDRRQFIISGGSLSLVAGSSVSFPFIAQNQPRYSIGYVENWTLHLGPTPDYLDGLVRYQDLNSALAALKSGQIEGLLSTPELWASYRPEISVFGSLTNLGSLQNSSDWVQNNYERLNDFYSSQGLTGYYLGLSPSTRLRVTSVNEDRLMNSRKHIRVAANGARAIWFEKMGFQVLGGNLVDKFDKQLEMISRNKLEISDAFYPGLTHLSTEHNFNISTVPVSGHKGHRFLVDPVTRSGYVFDLLTLKKRSVSNETAEKMLKITEQLKSEEQRQIIIAAYLESKLQLDQRIQMPEALQAEILKCNRSYVVAASMTSDPYGWANSLRKAIS